MKISNSKAKTWRRCPKKYEFKYIFKLKPKRRELPLERGSWRAYDHEDSHWTVVDQELDEFVTLPNGLRLHIIVDLIVEDHMGLWIVDHKFRGKFARRTSMTQDPQLTMYFWGLQKMGYKPIVGVIYNEVLTKPPTEPPVLKSRKVSTAKKWLDGTDVLTYASAVRANGQDLAAYATQLRYIAANQHEKFYRRTYLPKDPPMVRNIMNELVYTSREIARAERRSEFPRTFDASCEWQCEYRDLCISQLHGGDISSMVKADFIQKED
jgi:hypothetical protein